MKGSQQLDALLGYGGGVAGSEGDPGAAAFPHLLKESLVSIVSAVSPAHERGVTKHVEETLVKSASLCHSFGAVG